MKADVLDARDFLNATQIATIALAHGDGSALGSEDVLPEMIQRTCGSGGVDGDGGGRWRLGGCRHRRQQEHQQQNCKRNRYTGPKAIKHEGIPKQDGPASNEPRRAWNELETEARLELDHATGESIRRSRETACIQYVCGCGGGNQWRQIQ